jgi:hypothetical protein
MCLHFGFSFDLLLLCYLAMVMVDEKIDNDIKFNSIAAHF